MNFLKKKVKKAFQSFTADDGSDEGSGGHGGSFHSSSSGGGAEVMCLIIICIYKRNHNPSPGTRESGGAPDKHIYIYWY